MLFKRITYKNYRCFLDGTIEFNPSGKKNMSILIAPNGGGKTETLFSFWWTLYDFDFSTLRNKENTPYAINSALYRELEKSAVGTERSCSVTLEFEENNIPYTLVKHCDYRKTDKKIVKEEYKTLTYINENGETVLPIRDKEEIEKKLGAIIPKKILNGIIFDGERMQKLSSTDESSIEAIKGVINDISNVELLERCKTYFDSIKSKYNKELRKLKPKGGSYSLEKIIDLIKEKTDELEEKRFLLQTSQDEKEKVERELSVISDKLLKNNEVKEIEEKRKYQKDQLTEKQKELDSLYKSFSDSLNECYLFASTKLCEDVNRIVEDYKVPEGLTVNAVNSILDSPDKKCICGRELDDEAVKILKQLIKLLPPDNINSTLLEITRSIELFDIPKTKKTTKETFSKITKVETDIQNCKQEISRLSTLILSIDEDGEIAKEAIELENANKEANQKLGALKKTIEDTDKRIKELEPEIKKLQTQRTNLTSGEEISEKLNEKIDFVEKSISALEKIKEVNKETALDDVNEKLAVAYPLLSEDYERGRNIKILQYTPTRKYQMAVYMKNDVENLIDYWKNNGTYLEKQKAGLSDEEILESAIIKCIDSNSTGQSKINTFAFVKAILDYSNNPKKTSGIEIKKEYPLLIDAPFGDIAADNLRKSSTELHNFSHQVILLIDEDKYDTLRSAFDSYTSEKYTFEKVKGKNHSIIKKG